MVNFTDMLRRWIWTAGIVLFFAGTLFAQSIHIKAPQIVEQGQSFSITYSIEGREEIELIQQPSFAGFELLYGPAVGNRSSMSIINGNVRSESYSDVTYTLLADKEGKYNISGLKLRVNGKELSAKPISISVRAGSGQGGFAYDERPRQTERSEQAQYKYVALVPRRSVYVQEALPITYQLQSTEYPRLSRDIKPSVYDGFVSLDLLGSNPRQSKIQSIGGRDWVTADLIQELLFAQHPGQLTIPSNEVYVLYTHRDDSGNPFLNEQSEKLLRSEALQISVKPLPEAGKPEDFSGAVGSFTARYEVSSKEWKTNEASTIKLILEGQGNLKIAKLPKISLPNDIEVYDPVEKSEQSYQGGVLRSVRTIEYNLIPRNTGSITIPSVSLSYFNPTSGQYQRTQTKAIQVSISQGKQSQTEATILGTNKEGDEHTPYGLISDLEPVAPFAPYGLQLFFGHLAAICLAVLVYKVIRRRQVARADVLGFAASRAKQVAHKRLQQAKKQLEAQHKEAFLEATLNALWGYLGDKFKLPTSALNRDYVREHLQSLGVAEEHIQSLRQCIDDVEFARFAPSDEGSNLARLYEQAVEVITAIETSKIK